MNSPVRLQLLSLSLAALCAASGAFAQTPAAPGPAAVLPSSNVYALDVKIIEARVKAAPGAAAAPLDPLLAPLAADLNALPFENFLLVDTVQKDLQDGEAFTLQFGSPERRRFIRATAKGKTAGKVKVAVVLERQAGKKTKLEFQSDVSIPEAGTLVVVASKKNAPKGVVTLLAISAKTLPAGVASAAPAPASGSSGAAAR